MNGSRIGDRLNRFLSPARALLLLFLFYLLAAGFVLARYGFNPSALARFGHYYVEQNEAFTPTGAVRLLGNEENGGNGYDGQIFYYYARTLFLPGVWPDGFNNAYRAPRVGYPLLAAPFVVFGSWGVLFGLVFAQLALLGGGLLALLALLPADRRYLAIFWIISPFALQSFLLLVSDSVVAGLLVIGYYCFRLREVSATPAGRMGASLGAWACFALAALTKESALFLLFPLGLASLWKRDLRGAILMALVLVPMAGWQLYLRQAHGMIPAGVLSLFLSPLDGVFGLARETVSLIGDLWRAPGGAAALALIKHSAKVLLFLLIPAALRGVGTGSARRILPLRLAALFTLASVLIADWYYFWSVYENISRMFTVLVPIMVLTGAEDKDARTAPFFAVLSVLALLVFARTAALTPRFPYDTYHPYTGPNYSKHVIVPGDL